MPCRRRCRSRPTNYPVSNTTFLLYDKDSELLSLMSSHTALKPFTCMFLWALSCNVTCLCDVNDCTELTSHTVPTPSTSDLWSIITDWLNDATFSLTTQYFHICKWYFWILYGLVHLKTSNILMYVCYIKYSKVMMYLEFSKVELQNTGLVSLTLTL